MWRGRSPRAGGPSSSGGPFFWLFMIWRRPRREASDQRREACGQPVHDDGGAKIEAAGRTTPTDDRNIQSRTARGVVCSSHSNALSACAPSWLLLSKAPPSGPRRICLVRSRACAEATLNHIPGSASAPGGSDGRSILASCSIGAATSRNRAIRLLFAPARMASTLLCSSQSPHSQLCTISCTPESICLARRSHMSKTTPVMVREIVQRFPPIAAPGAECEGICPHSRHAH